VRSNDRELLDDELPLSPAKDSDHFESDSLTLHMAADCRASSNRLRLTLLPMTSTCAVLLLVPHIEHPPPSAREPWPRAVNRHETPRTLLWSGAGIYDSVWLHLDARQHHLHARHGLVDGLAARKRNAERFFRSSARSSGLTVLARTMTLRNPIFPIAWSSAFFLPPAPDR